MKPVGQRGVEEAAAPVGEATPAVLPAHQVSGGAAEQQGAAVADAADAMLRHQLLALAEPEQLEAARVCAAVRQRLFGTPAAPPRLGRFELTRPLGRGAMGVVFLARDTELERDVALKIVQPWTKAEQSDRVRRRLLREARAMARLRHPNVVAVFEVGVVDERAFIAMEYVQGTTLREWLAARPRSWPHVLEVFGQAGRGLAAAHAADLVHRDFKPDNVLIGNDGRVQVSDFGVARALAEAAGEPALAGSGSKQSAVDPHRTHLTDQLRAGTPCYMAPEQHGGGRVDARSDQFAFCAALFEALFGQLPFEGATIAEFAEQVRAGRIRRPHRLQRVPRWLYQAILRGLRPNPDRRHPSMAALLGELRPPSLAPRSWLLGAGLVAALGAGVLAVADRPRSVQHGGSPPGARAAVDGGARPAAPPVATTGASVASGRPVRPIGSITIPAGRTPGSNLWLPEYTIVHHQGDEGTDIAGAHSQCRTQALALCGDAQWMRACQLDRRLATVETWTATAASDRGFVVRGGSSSCNDRRVASGGEQSPQRGGVCCSRAVGMAGDSRSKTFLQITSDSLLRLESALSGVHIPLLSSMTDDRVSYLARPLSRERWLVELQRRATERPEQWVLHDVCDARPNPRDGERAWTADCRTLLYDTGQLGYANRRYYFGGPTGKLQSIAETTVFRPLSSPAEYR